MQPLLAAPQPLHPKLYLRVHEIYRTVISKAFVILMGFVILTFPQPALVTFVETGVSRSKGQGAIGLSISTPLRSCLTSNQSKPKTLIAMA